MRKLVILLCFGLLFFTDLSAETAKRFHVGLDVGGCPILEGEIGYRIGGGVGVKVSRRVGFNAEFGYAFKIHRGTNFYPGDKTSTISSVPLSGSIVFITPVTECFSAHIGLGLGYYFIKVLDEYDYFGTPLDINTKMQGIAPHVSLAFEAEVSKGMAIYASVKEIVGKVEQESTDGSAKRDVHISGQEIKVGLRFYF